MNSIVNIDVDDLEKAVAFYASAFGLKDSRRLFGNTVAEMLGSSSRIHLLAKPPGSSPGPHVTQARDYRRHWTPVHLDFLVDEIEPAVRRAVAAGARLEGEIQSYHWGELATLSDPFGHGFCLLRRRRITRTSLEAVEDDWRLEEAMNIARNKGSSVRLGVAAILSMAIALGAATSVLALKYPEKPIRMIVPFAQGGRTGSRRGGWCWGGDGALPPGLWHRILQRVAIALVAAAALAAGASFAQPYPSKPIRLIVPFAPGGGTDVLARFLSVKLSENLGVSLVIENRGGAGGTIGAELASRAAADGYTLLFTSASYSFNPSLYSKLGYDPLKDFKPITLIAMVPHLLVVHPSLPVKNVRELIALARKRPGEVFYGSGGTGSSVHLAAVLFVSLAKVNMTHVPYKGGGPAMIGVMAGEASVMFPTMQSVLPHVKSGRLRALAISTVTRSPAVPDVSTVAESGLPGYDATGWYGMLAPTGTPEAAIDRLHSGVVAILNIPELKQRLAAEGAIAVGNTPAEFDRFIRQEIAKWAKLIRSLNLKVD